MARRRAHRCWSHRIARVALLACAAPCVVAAVAAAAVIGGSDRKHGARFSLSGRTLTVTLSATSNVRRFAGQRVRADCVSQLKAGDGVARTLRWPAGSRRLVVRFAAGAGSAPVFCSIDTASLRARSYHIDAVLR
ncbi:MAG: hypothetical protein QOJ35_2812 [Solirubrobacteraceae bacterium]|nr:hypothetical protein [Solirubrobacteraceae bacterium]